MGVYFEAGYTLPGGDEPLTHARILHDKNRFRAKSVTASNEVAGFEADSADNGLTYEKWKPFANALTSGDDLSDAAWTLFQATLGSDNQTLIESTSNSLHYVQQAFTFTAAQYVLSARIRPITRFTGRLRINDGTNSFLADFNLITGVVTLTAPGMTAGKVVDLGDGTYLVRGYATPSAGTGYVRVNMGNDSGAVTYLGDGASSFQVLEVACHLSESTLRLDTFSAAEGDVFCIAGHNIGTAAGRLTFQHDSNNDDTFTDIGTATPTTDMPLMFIFAGITSSRWRIKVDRASQPEISVMRVGKALQMEQPIYGGHSPLDLARQTVLRANYSETGEFLGRTKQRMYFETAFAWEHLTAAWVRTNWRTFQLAGETEPFFIAWRPTDFSEVGYVQADQIPGAQNMGVRDFMSASVTVRGLGYD